VSAHPGVVGVFGALDAAVAAIESLKAKGYANYRVYSPVPRPELADALAKKESPVRLFTLVGALSGTAFGFFYAIATSLDWPLVTGGKPIVSWPPFIVIGFETTILIGALVTVAGMFLLAGLPKLGRAPGYDPRFSQDKFGVVAFGGPAQLAEAREIFAAAGAEEVKDA
jgi:molybdopterin-containing oxidoreductase family membrane subunit